MVALTLLAGTARASSTTTLSVTYWPHGHAGSPVSWTLRCAPPRGTHPLASRSCLEISRHLADLLPATTPCRLLFPRAAPYARVRGTALGRTVDRVLHPGCGTGWRDLVTLVTAR
jgi:hypothetical protein